MILILRLATLGNVAMTVPVISAIAMRYPEEEFVIAALKPLGAMFYGLKNVRYHEIPKGNIRTIWHDLQLLQPQQVIDLQDSWETRCLDLGFRMRGAKITRIHYGRWQKRMITLRGVRSNNPLPSEFERYFDTFARAGFRAPHTFNPIPVHQEAAQAVRERWGKKEGTWIGIAPFAKSRSNMLPYRVTKEVIQQLSNKPDCRIFLFGAGKIECELLRQWADVFPRTISVAGQLPLEQELELMRQLDHILCMDSANQHLAALVGRRALSVWCATHPAIGFMAWNQQPTDILQLNHLKCRPCTCHGTNHCRYRNFACRQITAEQILKRIYE